MQELPFLRSARRLMLIDICMKFREDSFRGFQVTERTGFATDRRTDRQTPGEKQYVSQPFGGRHNPKSVPVCPANGRFIHIMSRIMRKPAFCILCEKQGSRGIVLSMLQKQ